MRENGTMVTANPAFFKLTGKLATWAEQNGEGEGFDSSTGFILPNGAKRAPDASWIRRERWDALPKKSRQKFAHICPDFVVELTSPSDSLNRVQKKMRDWIENGAQLGWLLDADNRTAYWNCAESGPLSSCRTGCRWRAP